MFNKKSLEKEINDKMKQDEAVSKFTEQIEILERKKQNLIEMGAEAEINGDLSSLELAENNILFIQETLNNLKQAKLNFDIITVTSDITLALASAFSAMDGISRGNPGVPNYKKIMNTQVRLAKYMKEAHFSQEMIKSMLKRSNPSGTVQRSSKEREGVKMLIAAQRAKMTGNIPSGGGISLADEIAKEKSATIK